MFFSLELENCEATCFCFRFMIVLEGAGELGVDFDQAGSGMFHLCDCLRFAVVENMYL